MEKEAIGFPACGAGRGELSWPISSTRDDARPLLALPLAHVTGFAVATLTLYNC
jgi:hypothetical protein